MKVTARCEMVLALYHSMTGVGVWGGTENIITSQTMKILTFSVSFFMFDLVYSLRLHLPS